MGRKRIDLTGQRFGRLVVISLNEEVSKQKKGSCWNCKCDCGNEKIIWAADLKRGNTTSCGCYNKEMVQEKWNDEEFRQMRSANAREQTKEQWKDEEFRQMQSNRAKALWKDEEFRQMQSEKLIRMNEEMSGVNSPHWKGGISPISTYLRDLLVVKQWRKDTYVRENSKCQLTGKHVHGGNSVVHHLYGFNMIVLEAHELHNIQIKSQVKDYTEKELH